MTAADICNVDIPSLSVGGIHVDRVSFNYTWSLTATSGSCSLLWSIDAAALESIIRDHGLSSPLIRALSLVIEVVPADIIPNPLIIESLVLRSSSIETTELVIKSLPHLKEIEIGDNSFGGAYIFSLENLKVLQTVTIGSRCFSMSSNTQQQANGSARIVNCNSLVSIDFRDRSFQSYQFLELTGLPSLRSIKMGMDCFSYVQNLVIKGWIEELG